MRWLKSLLPRIDHWVVWNIVMYQLEPIMANLDQLNASLTALTQSVAVVDALCASLQSQLTTLAAAHGATPEELATLQAAIDTQTATLNAIVARTPQP